MKTRNAAYLKYINNDSQEFGAQDNKWALDKANREVAEYRKEVKKTNEVYQKRNLWRRVADQ